MLYANTKDGQKIRATEKNKSEGVKAYCPICDWPQCKKTLDYRLGKVNIHHFAHQKNSKCSDDWSRGKESEWHCGWKKLVNKKYCEVPIVKGWDKHRADIQNKNGLVVELQNSSISVSEIQEREKFYGNMIWLFNEQDSRIIVHSPSRHSNDDYWPSDCNMVIWKNAKKTILESRKRIFLDLGNEQILYLVKNLNDSYYHEWKKAKVFGGYLINKNDFIDYFLKTKENDAFDNIHESLLEGNGWYLQQLKLFEKYYKWLLRAKTYWGRTSRMTEKDVFCYYFINHGFQSHLPNLRDFIKKHPEYDGKQYLLFKTIKLGIELGWHTAISDELLRFE